MPLDDLVHVIETLQQRIKDHGDSLRQNETRTRMALIDPLLQALGWDVADPGLVTPEYSAGNGRADYALLGGNGNPAAFIEAKHFGEPLERPQHTEQVFTYALIQQVRYAGLTDGNLWVLDNVAEFSGGERRLLQVSIANEPAHQCALKFLLLWRPNLASGQPVAASEPVLTTASDTEPAIAPTPVKLGGEGWVSLADFQLGTGNQPPEIHLPDGTEKQLRYWYQILAETAEWLIRTGLITADRCPMRNSGRISIVHTEPRHESGNEFFHPLRLSNGLFLNKHGNRKTLIDYTKFLLQPCGQDPASVWLKFS